MRLYDVVSRCGSLQKEPLKRGLRQKNIMSYGSSTVPCITEIREVNTNPTPSWPIFLRSSREYLHSCGNDRVASCGCSSSLMALFPLAVKTSKYAVTLAQRRYICILTLCSVSVSSSCPLYCLYQFPQK